MHVQANHNLQNLEVQKEIPVVATSLGAVGARREALNPECVCNCVAIHVDGLERALNAEFWWMGKPQQHHLCSGQHGSYRIAIGQRVDCLWWRLWKP